MFTGIVEATGTIQSIARAAPEATTARLTVSTALDLSNAALGASIAVDGVCLTIVDRDAARGMFAADLGPETLMLTTLGRAARPGRASTSSARCAWATSWAGTWSAATSTTSGTVVARRENGGALDLEISAPASRRAGAGGQGVGRRRRRQPDHQRPG